MIETLPATEAHGPTGEGGNKAHGRDAHATVCAAPGHPFTEDYFLRGKETGLSNYENYRHLPELTEAYARHLVKHLDIKVSDFIHDIGCARGYLVKALRDLGYWATGHDISEWAISNCHPDVAAHVSTACDYAPNSIDWIHAKDCCEHWNEAALREALPRILDMARKGCFFIIPLTAYWGGKYIYPADNEDKTHRIHLPMDSWLRLLMEAATKTAGTFSIHGSYNMHGLKKASVEFPYSTGFLTVRRFN